MATPKLVSVKPNTDFDAFPFSHSRLTDICTCPTYGAVRAQRTYPSTTRAMPLEAGGAMHEVFAAIRCWQLAKVQHLPKHAAVTADRLFGQRRWKECVSKDKDPRDNLLELCFNILHSGGFTDDPGDKIRTISNLESAIITYVDEIQPSMEDWPIWVADVKDPKQTVGIEQTFDAELAYSDGMKIRFIGTIDGLVLNKVRDRYTLDENKTASRLDPTWEDSFEMNHQITGNCACSTTVYGFGVLHARVLGLKLRPSQTGESFLPHECLARDANMILHWANWVRYGASLYNQYKNDWEHAPRFAHSCNRYFRSCHLLPFCADTPSGRQQQWEGMIDAPLSPSEQATDYKRGPWKK